MEHGEITPLPHRALHHAPELIYISGSFAENMDNPNSDSDYITIFWDPKDKTHHHSPAQSLDIREYSAPAWHRLPRTEPLRLIWANQGSPYLPYILASPTSLTAQLDLLGRQKRMAAREAQETPENTPRRRKKASRALRLAYREQRLLQGRTDPRFSERERAAYFRELEEGGAWDSGLIEARFLS